jgi:ComF family protein
MSCTSCSTGKPGGCKSNGGCSTGGCNRMNVHDWLENLPFSDPESNCRIVEVSFNQGSRKDFFRNNSLQYFEKGDIIAVEGVSGFDVGTVSITGELVRLQLKKHGVKEDNPDIKKILRLATDNDIIKWKDTKSREHDVLIRSRAIARQLNVDLKMAEVEVQADSRKATFFYIADERVDFRELIRIYASEFKVKVEMKQIGARQEAGKVGGIGSCGRELCCSTWLTDFKSVNTNAARYQNLSINQTKLSGQCGRLKCCLNYELDTYLDALQHFPDDAEVIEVAKGRAFLIKKDIFRNLMGKSLKSSNRFSNIDLLIPLPLFTKKEFKRGYNQAEVLCAGIAEVMNIPILTKNVIRIVHTETQTKKGRIERWENVEKSFAVKDPGILKGKHILLVDDVITTGATMEACGSEILKTGGAKLSFATLAFAAK